jgi:plasmid stabilization system protein ParE
MGPLKYRVELTDDARRAIVELARYLHSAQAPSDRIERWVNGLYDAIDSLTESPRRFPVHFTHEQESLFEIRRMNYGSVHVFFYVLEGDGVVEVVNVRHASREPWSPANG